MKIMLDTNICIALIARRPDRVVRRFASMEIGSVGISAITLAELQFGVAKSVHVERNREALDQFTLPLVIAPFDENAAKAYGHVRAFLERKGKPIGAADTMIAGHAIALGATLVTNNLREFSRVPGLAAENWLAA